MKIQSLFGFFISFNILFGFYTLRRMVQASLKRKRISFRSLRGPSYKEKSRGQDRQHARRRSCTARNRDTCLPALSHGTPGSPFSLTMAHTSLSTSDKGEATLWGMGSYTSGCQCATHQPPIFPCKCQLLE